MNPRINAVLAGLAVLPAVAGEQEFPRLSELVPHFEKRLRSTRWEVRYCLLSDLDGRDAESKRALELLSRDGHDAVASQALRRYVGNFVSIDRSLFRPEVYFHGTPFLGREPMHARELVDRCLVRLRTADEARDAEQEAAGRADPAVADALVVVGILGTPEDSVRLQPFLDSKNDYVAIQAAKAVIRLGQTQEAADALIRLTKRDPAKHLHYVTEALRLLKELDHPEFKASVLDALSAVDRTEGIPPNWLNEFLLLAAEIDGNVWLREVASGAAGAGEPK